MPRMACSWSWALISAVIGRSGRLCSRPKDRERGRRSIDDAEASDRRPGGGYDGSCGRGVFTTGLDGARRVIAAGVMIGLGGPGSGGIHELDAQLVS